MTAKSILTGISLVTALTAQVTREHSVLLKNWPAPLYWQPSPTESETLGDKSGTIMQPHAATGSLVFVAITPCRVVDTRASQMFAAPFGAPSLTPGPARSFPVQSSTLCSIPPTAQAYSFNVTVLPPGVLGYLTIYPHGQLQPNAVTLDDLLGTIVNNAAIVPAGTVNGSVDVVVNANTDLVLDINGYYALPNPTVNTANGLNALAGNTTGTDNTANGYGALFSNTIGSYNSASGALALNTNTTGNYNTATGFYALNHNTTGSANTAVGDYALLSNTTGGSNTASGYNALVSNTTGLYNTGNGGSALSSNSTGSYNTANGYDALYNNTGNIDVHTPAGLLNTASGAYALFSNTIGQQNTANGYSALYSNTTGGFNTATGNNSLQTNATGTSNTAIGLNALYGNYSGSSNIALGNAAGLWINGDNNIDIGNQGGGGDSGVIRIGDTARTSFFAAGIRGIKTNNGDAIPVLIDSAGQLGTTNSSRRFKEDIQDMNDSSSGLLRLRPVTYRYQQPYGDGTKPIDYGLIAEEVAEVYPDLVVKGADGQIETVQYQKLTPMLLNEVQKDHETMRAMQAQIDKLQTEHETLRKALDAFLSSRPTAQ